MRDKNLAKHVLLLAPFGAFCLSPLWLPDRAFGAWPFTAFVAISTLLLLPWLKAYAYPDKSWPTVLWIQGSGVLLIASLEFISRGRGSRMVDYLSIAAGAAALGWYAIRERKRNQLARDAEARR